MPFPIHPHMLRHTCGFKLANDGHDTRALQHYLGYKPSGTPKWRPTDSRTFGGTDDGGTSENSDDTVGEYAR
jgi:Phage integrase family